MAKHPAIFLHRDRTIKKKNGYIKNHLAKAFFPYTYNALQNLQEHFLLFNITNQRGVFKSLMPEDGVREVRRHVVGLLGKRGITIFEVNSYPHKSLENCERKKPKTYFIHPEAGLCNIDLTTSFLAGGQLSDIRFGIHSGVTPQ